MTSPTFPTASGPLVLPGPVGDLDAAIDLPDADVVALPLVAVVCHPLPTEGGTMHNKVVTMVARSLREFGATSVRFNFRGTGESAGSFDNGVGEIDDLVAVIDWVRRERPGHRLWLAGFSFGAYVSLRASTALQPDLLISVAPPAGRWDFDAIELPTCPWLVIQGESDEIVDPQAVYDWLETSGAQAELVRMPETSHFFHRRMIDLRGVVKHWVEPHLPQASA
ncbi:MAG: alpha/beta hydrolase [Luteimonas sp.]